MIAGVLVNGVGGRLAMMLLARLNPAATGVVSDDGFVMGRFDLANTLGFVAQMTLLGILGGVLALALRSLRFGPRWFRWASWVVGPGVVVGSMLVHSDGVDFRLLGPLPLTVGLFVAIPGLYALVVVRLLDWWVAPRGWPWAPGRRWLLGLVPLAATGPGMLLLVPGVLLRVTHHHLPVLQGDAAQRSVRVAGRVILLTIFASSCMQLLRTVGELR